MQLFMLTLDFVSCYELNLKSWGKAFGRNALRRDIGCAYFPQNIDFVAICKEVKK